MATKPTIWCVTDTHFNHPGMVQCCGRPENFDKVIIAKWQKSVAPDDIVIHLGDVIFRNPGDLGDIMASLPGTKWLVKGNHDAHSQEWYLQRGFACVVDALEMHGVYFTHVPSLTLPPTCTINICGHVHNNPKPVIDYYDPTLRFYPWHYILALENMKYAPRPLNEILSGRWIRTDLCPHSVSGVADLVGTCIA